MNLQNHFLMIERRNNQWELSWHRPSEPFGTGFGIYDCAEKAIESAEHLAGLIHKRPTVKYRPPILVDTRDAPRLSPPVIQCARCDCGALVPPDRINCPSCEALI
jgi:hypothetical protein